MDDKHPKWKLRMELRELAGREGADIAWNQALLDLGALVCTARSPKCKDCPVLPHCETGKLHPQGNNQTGPSSPYDDSLSPSARGAG